MHVCNVYIVWSTSRWVCLFSILKTRPMNIQPNVDTSIWIAKKSMRSNTWSRSAPMDTVARIGSLCYQIRSSSPRSVSDLLRSMHSNTQSSISNIIVWTGLYELARPPIMFTSQMRRWLRACWSLPHTWGSCLRIRLVRGRHRLETWGWGSSQPPDLGRRGPGSHIAISRGESKTEPGCGRQIYVNKAGGGRSHQGPKDREEFQGQHRYSFPFIK